MWEIKQVIFPFDLLLDCHYCLAIWFNKVSIGLVYSIRLSQLILQIEMYRFTVNVLFRKCKKSSEDTRYGQLLVLAFF